MVDLEEGNVLQLDYSKLANTIKNCKEVIPVAVQNIDTQEVILLAFVNEIALKESIRTRAAVFLSTSRNEIWEKGKVSGEIFDLIEIYVNCEQNSLLYRVKPRRGGICHTRNKKGEPRNCYYRKLNLNTLGLENVDP